MMFRLTEVVKNLLIINGLVFLASQTFPEFMYQYMSLHHPYSPDFMPHQIVTHIFMHSFSDGNHILMNMLGLFFLGGMVEDAMGSKRFLSYYMLTGFGAAALQLGIKHIEVWQAASVLSSEQIDLMISATKETMGTEKMWKFYSLINSSMIGASGAIFGIIIAFGMLFAEMNIRLYFVIQIKGKYVAMILGSIEVLAIIMSKEDGVAHYAHMGGIFIGFLLINKWGLKQIM